MPPYGKNEVSPREGCDPTFDELPWYRAWVLQQVCSQPQRLLLSLPDFNPDEDPDYGPFFLVWNQIRELALVPGPKNINTITDALRSQGVISTEHNYEAAQSAKELVFSIIGWQTMLYKPDFSPHAVCGVAIEWVDSLSCHLELDKRTGRLFLYRYPSFCVSCLHQHESRKEGNHSSKSILHRCALEKPGPAPWATEEDVTGLLQEILLSYRLIFAVVERDEYDLAADFPHLRSRLARLHGYASGKKPRSIGQLWRDRRDSTAWLAFWSVLIFGSISVVLAGLQTVFQVLQYLEAKQGS
ncbi:uncharacterized protein THITE_2147952 [Thermothielavioides terrestris NRRL 8126]|uniref:Uncharacterized protein n=1 Tax=Thermothielavioides terrestris (strain ATCC 38088 / NRRL 8126) TaxID=578455 RepID=G2RHH2_THETT|nr:uncharacterized protein THITE_2147952 [Thermothielavioides terrestris NRRL 8126]AEO71284.1 hypothetical protein THITE_2147952 [Thermothielavioides terrestris NRRL 8126]